MTQKKQTDPNEELKNIPREETATTDTAEPTESAAPETAVESAVTAETVKAEMMDRILRLQADFDNYRRRTRQEQTELSAFVTQNLIKELLPVIDNFERGLAAVTDDIKEHSFVEGMDKTYRQMLTELEAVGVKPIEAVGCEFDPNFHNAVMHVEDDSAKENVVVEEFQKGYIYRDTVVRHSMVKVAN